MTIQGNPARPGLPVAGRERIAELDIVRGLALFGVLWMNLFEHADFVMPADKVVHLFGTRADDVVAFVSHWLAQGKAQALFSYLFGLGFALFLERAEANGADGTRLYLRRLSFLLVLGIAHALLLWAGDILNAYAMMGFLLLLTRRWPGWLLLGVGIAFAMFDMIAVRAFYDIAAPGQPLPWSVAQEAALPHHFAVFMGHDYAAYVRELAGMVWDELYAVPIGWAYLGWIFGRFCMGSWVYRQGWMQHPDRFIAGFRRWMPWLLGIGLVLALVGPAWRFTGIKPTGGWRYVFGVVGQFSFVVLPAGYAALIVVLCRTPAWRHRFAGLAAAGRMALTNYLTQSLLYFFVLYGFGLGLLPYMGATLCLLLALLFYAAQIAFSLWWLARYRFGPVEWLWRSFTYGARQPMRRITDIAGTVSA